MNEEKLRQDLDRGARAERLLKEELLQEAFSLVENHIMEMFRHASLRDDEGVLKSKQLLHALTLVRRALEQAVTDGKVAANLLEEKARGIAYLGDIWSKRQSK